MEVREQSVIEQFNLSNDYAILNILTSNRRTNAEKKYLIDNCQERIKKMDTYILLQTLRNFDYSFCSYCSSFIKDQVSSLNTRQIEDLLYQNKHYHDISDLAKYLTTEKWFLKGKNQEYQAFFLAYEIENILNSKNPSQEHLIDLSIVIINLLTKEDTSSELYDMIVKNYLSLLGIYNKYFIKQLKKFGYEIIDRHLSEHGRLLPNMIIFDCEITKFETNSLVDNFTFYDKDSGYDNTAFAFAHAGEVKINVAAIEDIYARYKKASVATQMIFYVIGHEINHIFCERYKTSETSDKITDLRVFNSRVSSSLHACVSNHFYRTYHNCFAHEYEANIAGIKSLYEKYRYLPSLTAEDREAINVLLAKILLTSYCEVEGPTKKGYFGPVEFTRDEFYTYKDNLPGYAEECLLNKQKDLPSELVELEDNLSEFDCFMLGYHNEYIGVLKLISDGKVKTQNIFDDIVSLYEENKDLIEYDYPPYIKRDKSSKNTTNTSCLK